MSRIRFYKKEYNKPPASNFRYPCLVFVPNSWNDYGYIITFRVYYYESEKNRSDLGNIKIFDSTTDVTELKASFFKLSSNQCSLGQSLEYYYRIKELYPSNYSEIFDALNDLAINLGIRKNFDQSKFKNTLLRFTAAEKAYDEARYIFQSGSKRKEAEFNFTYSVLLPGASKEHKVNFDFRKTNLPFRINVIIGKNGTGKTQLLGGLVNTISGVDKNGSFYPARPLFSNFIAISYSLFDKFPNPPQTNTFSYKYIGLRDLDHEIIDDYKIDSKLRNGLRQILEKGRASEWIEFISQIVDLKPLEIQDDEITERIIKKLITYRHNSLSSGQSVILFMLTELIANVEKDSLILFDEPETHLHPSALAQLIKVFYEILKEYKSYAIIATHSPIIVQDIPSACVRVFDRQGNYPIIRDLPSESFGENLSKITSAIFDTIDVKELYKEYIERLSRTHTIQEIEELFSKGLSINAKLFLTAIKNNE